MKFYAKYFDELTTVELYEILKSRMEIFVVEQGICYVDTDNVDYYALHCFYENDGRVVACLRAFYEDKTHSSIKIGRVLTLEHGVGLGQKLMKESIFAIKEKMKCKKICMDSQTHAIGFYKKFGFEAVSGTFLEEGIPHVSMQLML